MKEVSSKALHIWFKALARKDLPPDVMIAGTTLTVEQLKSRSGRVDWEQLQCVHRNIRPHFTDDELVDLGRTLFRPAALRFMFIIGRFLLTPLTFFRWLNTPKKGGGNQLFTCITPSFREISAHECEVDLKLSDGLEPDWIFFLITKGSFVEAPRLFGYGPATVSLESIPQGGRFRVTIPARTPLLGRLRRALFTPFAARAAAKELQAANEDLVERYEQLEKATAELEHYKTHLEQLVEQRTSELREAQSARERFFGNISHEIRTPLSLILLAAGDIDARAGAALDDRAHRSLGSISDGARKLVRLVDELLLLAAGQEHKLKLSKEPTDIGALVGKTVDAWRPAAEGAGLVLAAPPPQALHVSIDPVAIERVISNLLSNAVKYTPRGGRIEVELARESDGIRLSVLDTGPGIDDELAGRLFGRFERAQGADRRGTGTGIGLSLVKELVEAHGGKVSTHARSAGGTEMRVVLPAAASVAAPTAPARSRLADLAPRADATIASGTRLSPATSQGTILLAEDDPALAEMIANLLAEDYTVIVALDGAHAAELIPKHQPHLLVTDVDMPGMNGIDLSKKFRELTNDKLAPIIILSAVLDLGTRLAGLEAGAVDYVTKPFDPPELRARVRAQFRMRELALRLHRAEQLSTLGILTSGLAHELRNPANGIVNAVPPLRTLLPKDLTAPDTGVGQLLEVMEDCSKQIGALSRQLLSFRNGGTQLDLRPTDMPALIDRAITLATRGLEAVEVRKDLAFDGPVHCSPALLVQVLANLIENGGHAAGPGGWVNVRGGVRGAMVTIEVTDSGPGVPVSLRDRVFEPFYTTKPPGIGTGLGLPVSRAIVIRHGGVLEIRDGLERPAFVVEFPQKPGHGMTERV